MSSLPKPGTIVTALEQAATSAIGKDVSTIQGFAKDQLLRIEKLAIRLAEMITEGEFSGDPDGQKDWLDILNDLIRNFIKTLIGLSEITIEKVWNAMVNVVWNALDKATGLALPRP
jgi:hypothetical protein